MESKAEKWNTLKVLKGLAISDYEFSNYGRVKYRGEIQPQNKSKASIKIITDEGERYISMKMIYLASIVYPERRLTREDCEKVQYTSRFEYGINLDVIVDHSGIDEVVESSEHSFKDWLEGRCGIMSLGH